MDWVEEVRARVVPAPESAALTGPTVAAVLLVALVIVSTPVTWTVARIVVTLAHELGHALVGMAAGRRFTGFVVRADMSGHAVTAGPARGLGLVATTWAGYPAPAVAGAGLAWAAVAGWAAPLLTALLVVLAVAAIRVRSLLTTAVVLATAAALAALWWWRSDQVQAAVLVGLALVLTVGAWRHVGALRASRSPDSDARALGRLTGLPAGVWIASFVLAIAAASAGLALALRSALAL